MEETIGADNLSDWVFDNIQKIFFPEEWITLDQSVSKTELLALFFIERQGEATMTKLADFLSIPLSTATGIVDRLVKNGHLSRERADIDRRIIVLTLTVAGRAVVKELKDSVFGIIGEIEKGFSPEEKAQAMQLISKALSLIQKKGESACKPIASELRRIEIE
jgi:MarR family transcriptional regulator, organic hydroperoxide resistance regulator